MIKKNSLLSFTVTTALFSIFYMPIFVLYPMMTLNHFKKDQWNAGMVEIIFAIGMLCGAFALSRMTIKNKIKIVSISVFFIALSLSISGFLSVHSGFLYFVLISFIIGVASPFYEGLVPTIYGETIPETHLGRVMSLSKALSVLGTPIGIALSGLFTDLVGVAIIFTIFGLFLFPISALFLHVSRNG